MPFFFIATGYCFFHSFICCTHAFISRGSAFSINVLTAFFASATIGTETAIFLEIEAASMSIWIISALEANSSIFPVMRSLNLVPTENKTSHC